MTRNYKRISGGPAEQQFRAFAEAKGISTDRYGFDGADIKDFYALPSFVRNTPDFIATYKGKPMLVECKAGGNHNVSNLTASDLQALKQWNKVCKTFVFFNDSKNRKTSFISVDNLAELVEKHGDTIEIAKWPDDSVYYKIPKSLLTWENYSDIRT